MKKKSEEVLHQFIWYMVIFSIIGLILETMYCFITTGVLESRKGLILGPVCPIYGVGAVIIILGLNRFKGKKLKLFFLGMILGSAAEYLISFCLEAIYGTRFWEYSYMRFHLNGRISLIYTIFWGILSLLMIQYVKSVIDKLINKFKFRWLDIAILIFFIVDALVTIWGVNVYMERVQYGRKIKDNSNFFEKAKYTIEEKCFSNDIMSLTFPNIRVMDKDGNEVWVRELINK